MRGIKAIFSAGHFLARGREFHKPSDLAVKLICSLYGQLTMTSFTKTPNVLVYTGENSQSVFENAAKNLLSVLHPDKYVVYELTKSQVLVQPWRENIALLVVLSETIEESTAETFRNYLANDGKMMVFCSNFIMPEIGLTCTSSKEAFTNMKYLGKADMNVYHGKVSYSFENAKVLATDSNNVPVVMKTVCNQGILVVSQVHLLLDSDVLVTETKEAPDSKTDRLLVLETILSEVLGLEVCSVSFPEPSVGFVLVKDGTGLEKKLDMKEIPIEKGAAPVKVPLVFDDESTKFDRHAYFSNLNSKKFGHITIFFPVVTSTMIPAEHLSDLEGVVITAGRQTSGRGRGDNQWISPEGCAMFTVHMSLSLKSQLGQRLSILQHMATLAAVLAVKKIPGYEKLDLRLKWPNDLYYENDKKIGGVLVSTTIQGNQVHAYIGIGVNVANQRPTICINSIVETHNKLSGDSLPPLTTEIMIARVLTQLELLVDDFMMNGSGNFLASYYLYWLHAEQRITLDAIGKEATIKGLDDYGFLIVETDDGKTMTLQPDGNRFDMMRNLIVSK